jgi:hypothetical protein
MPKQVNKSDPNYLARLGAREGLAIAQELYRTNKKEIDEGRQLTIAEYQFLLKYTTDRLIKNGELPPLKSLSAERFEAFEHDFYSTILHEGLL